MNFEQLWSKIDDLTIDIEKYDTKLANKLKDILIDFFEECT